MANMTGRPIAPLALSADERGIGRRRARSITAATWSFSIGTRLAHQPVNAPPHKAPSPLADGVLMNAEFNGNGLALFTFGAFEDDPAALRQ